MSPLAALLLRFVEMKGGWPVAVLLLVAGLAALGVRSCQLSAAERRAETCQQQGADLRERAGGLVEQAAACRASLAAQNAAVAQWQQEADLQQGRAEVAEAKGRQVEVRTVERVREIHDRPPPSDCEGAVSWARQRAADLSGHWQRGQQ